MEPLTRELLKKRMETYLKFWFTDSSGVFHFNGMSGEDLDHMFEYMMTGDVDLITTEWDGYGN